MAEGTASRDKSNRVGPPWGGLHNPLDPDKRVLQRSRSRNPEQRGVRASGKRVRSLSGPLMAVDGGRWRQEQPLSLRAFETGRAQHRAALRLSAATASMTFQFLLDAKLLRTHAQNAKSSLSLHHAMQRLSSLSLTALLLILQGATQALKC